ncbi:MAG: hypothetical protein H7A25_09160 [Leptospiraceae bacterium]|nr:hypothetical protein [Leptospiraceae bacterium]
MWQILILFFLSSFSLFSRETQIVILQQFEPYSGLKDEKISDEIKLKLQYV